MRRLTLLITTCLSWLILNAQFQPFRFALLTDTHVSRTSASALKDLQNSIDEINQTDSLDFVIVSGDLTDAGDKYSMQLVRHELDRLTIPYHVTSGNHETKWSESGCTDFDNVFGSNRFEFAHKGVYFIGFNSGPVIKMSDGHVAPQDISWLARQLHKASLSDQVKYIIPVTHYPLQTGDVDNWFDLTDLLRQYNVQCIIGGHYHRNLMFNCDDIPDVLCRSNLRGKDEVGGYTIIRIDNDSIRFLEKVIGNRPLQWASLPLCNRHYSEPDPSLRPDYSVNNQYPKLRHKWQTDLKVGIYAAPVVYKNNIYLGDDEGNFYCLSLSNGKVKWQQTTGSRIISTAAADNQKVVVGSTDHNIYCFDARNGNKLWQRTTNMAVMGCPVIDNGIVYIGGSDSCMYALRLDDGSEVWTFNGVNGYIETRPCIYNGRLYFGAWDCYFYCLELSTGKLLWKWTNGMRSDKYSPAAVWPVAANGRIYITAPDRVFTALDANTGEAVWRTKQHVVRETVGISHDNTMVFSRCMWDSIVAMDATTTEPVTLWKTDGQYGYDHNPSMLIEKNGVVVFGTKNGLLLGIDAKHGDILWRHKLSNSVLNTVSAVSNRKFVVSSSDGKVTYVVDHNTRRRIR